MITAVDTNVLLDVLLADERFLESSIKSLEEASREGDLIICEAVMAELASAFIRSGREESELFSFLSDLGIELVPSGAEVAIRAAEAWSEYVSRRGAGVICPGCGEVFDVRCPSCGRSIRWRQHVITDFLIGAHASVHAGRLLTREGGYYRSYFPELEVVYRWEG